MQYVTIQILLKINKYEKLCEALQKHVNHLKYENQRLTQIISKNDISKNTSKESQTPILLTKPSNIYHTDDEDLAHETEWIVQKHKKRTSKKRKAESSPELETSSQASKSLKTQELPFIINQKRNTKNNSPQLPLLY